MFYTRSSTRRQKAISLHSLRDPGWRKLHPDTCVHNDVYGAKNTGQTGFEHVCPKERHDLSTPFALARTGHTIRPNPKRVDVPSHYGQEGEELERKQFC